MPHSTVCLGQSLSAWRLGMGGGMVPYSSALASVPVIPGAWALYGRHPPRPRTFCSCQSHWMVSLPVLCWRVLYPLQKTEDLWCYLYRNSDPKWFPALRQGWSVFFFFTFFPRCSGLSPVPSRWQACCFSPNISRLTCCGLEGYR